MYHTQLCPEAPYICTATLQHTQQKALPVTASHRTSMELQPPSTFKTYASPSMQRARRWRRSCRAAWRRCDALRRAYLRACCWHPPQRACPARPAACRAGIAVRRLSTASTWPKPAGVPMSCALLVFSTHYEAMGAACGPKESESWTWRVPAGAPWPALRAAWRTKTAGKLWCQSRTSQKRGSLPQVALPAEVAMMLTSQ